MNVAEFREAVLPMHIVREHVRMDDKTGMSDELLDAYRTAAFDGAGDLTGFWFGPAEDVDETTTLPEARNGQRTHFIRTTWRIADDGLQWSAPSGGGRIASPRFAISHRLPIRQAQPDLGGVPCGPCCAETDRSVRLFYRRGFACHSDVPGSIKVGILKVIAHMVGNMGDALHGTPMISDTRQLVAADPFRATGVLLLWQNWRTLAQ